MTVAVCYPVPLDSPALAADFLPDIQRFCRSWRKFPPGWKQALHPADCTLYAVCCNGDAPQSLRDEFWGLPATFCRYDGSGTDAGASQWLAGQLPGDTFQISLTSRVFFHAAEWLPPILEARSRQGRGLYGTSVSREGGALHVCTRCYGLDCADLNAYPVLLDSRNKGTLREIGGHGDLGTLADWMAQQRGAGSWVVYRSGHYHWQRAQDQPNIFRRGDQSNLLVHDRHTLIYEQASPEEKQRLENLCHDPTNPASPSP